MPLTSPYNFVPINRQVYYPWWGDCISMDIPFRDGEDGYIEVTLRNVSPLFTRNGSRLEKDKRDIPRESSHIVEANGDKRYFIPGTTIKGMLRATLEIMAFGKMSEKQHYTNRWFGYRDIGGSGTYRDIVSNRRAGWLSKDPDDKYYFEQCEYYDQIKFEELKGRFKKFRNDQKSVWKTNCSLTDSKVPQYPIYEKDGIEYRIVCTGGMDSKNHELLFSTELRPMIEVSEQTIQAFMTVYETSPDFDKFVKELDRGEKIPVFMLNDSRLPINPVIGMSKMFKLPYKNSITNLINNEQSGVQSARDLCEAMFGTISDKKNLKGRIQVGHAFATDANSPLMGEVSGVLGQPKASYYPLYVKQSANPYKNYDNGTAMSGRKMYRVHRSNTPAPLPTGNDGENVKTYFNALAPGQEFKLRINIHNLKTVEIGALLSALTLHETAGVYHNIGLAKSFGYGKLEVESITLHGLNRKWTDYEMAFEDEMNTFLKMKWRDTDQVRNLMSILGEHDNDAVAVMELEAYGQIKKKGKPESDKLSETPRSVASLTGPIDEFRKAHSFNMDAVKQLWKNGQIDEALQEIEKLIGLFEFEGLPHGVETSMRNKILDAINQREKERIEQEEHKMIEQQKLQEKAEQEAKEKQAQDEKLRVKLEAGLSAQLDEKFDNGTYKVTTMKTCFSKVNDWLKKSGKSDLSEEEKEVLKHVLTRIVQKPDKREMRDLKKFNNKLWQEVVKHLGDTVATELFGMLN